MNPYNPQSMEYAQYEQRRQQGLPSQSEELEARAVALLKQMPRWMLPAPGKAFFNDLADFLKWEKLKKELQ